MGGTKEHMSEIGGLVAVVRGGTDQVAGGIGGKAVRSSSEKEEVAVTRIEEVHVSGRRSRFLKGSPQE